jgi:hypothetical protein
MAIDDAALEKVNEDMDAMLAAANAACENVELLSGHDPRYDGALVQGTMAYIQSAYPETAERADAALQALTILGGGEEKMN